MANEQLLTKEGHILDNCQFCTAKMSGFSHFEERGLPRLDTVHVRDTENFFVIPDSLPVHPEGHHLVIVPRQHVYSYAQLPVELGVETHRIIEELQQTLGEELALFEHGALKHGGKHQSVYHAHAHLIGTGGNNVIGYMDSALRNEGVSEIDMASVNGSLTRNVRSLYKGTNYFYIQQDRYAMMIHDPNNCLPSQIAQRNMSMLLTGEVVNWKEISTNPRFADLSVQRITNVVRKLGAI